MFYAKKNYTKTECIQPEVSIVLAADQNYVPILYTCMQPIVLHTSSEHIYDIYVFHTNIESDSQQPFLTNLQTSNINISFINVLSYLSGYTLDAHGHITTETYYRFLILEILKEKQKVLYLDCDTIVCDDLAKLYHTDLTNHLIAAAIDPAVSGAFNNRESDFFIYAKDVLHMKNPFRYFQAGVLLLNVQKLRQITTVQKLFSLADTHVYRLFDQDILNMICYNQVLYFDMKWNLLFDCAFTRVKNEIALAPDEIQKQYHAARKHPSIIHYAGHLKPWQDSSADFATEFWRIARMTPFYQSLLSSHRVHRFIRFIRKIVRLLIPRNTKLRQWLIQVYRHLVK